MRKRWAYLAGGMIVTLAVAGIVAVRTSAASDSAGGEGELSAGFSKRSIKGAWAFSAGLSYVVPPGFPQPLPFVGIGRVVFDGEGGCTVENVVNVNGQVSRFRARTCHYDVTADGFGTAEADFPDAPVPGVVPLAFVIADHGHELRMIDTNFLVASLTARRQ